jgi:hypothetical protein
MSISLASRWAALAVLTLSGTLHAEPRPVERVVARVDGSPILLSELLTWARPRLAHLRPAGWVRAGPQLLLGDAEEAIRAALQASAHDSASASVTREVEATLAQLAANQRRVDELLAGARRGLSRRTARARATAAGATAAGSEPSGNRQTPSGNAPGAGSRSGANVCSRSRARMHRALGRYDRQRRLGNVACAPVPAGERTAGLGL